MFSENSSSDSFQGSETLSCNITSIQFNHQEKNDFLWLKNSSQPDTYVGQQNDGIIAVLKIKEGGFIARFVLDPNLICAFWDNEEICLHYQNLFAQHKNGNVVLYTVDEGGVTETLHILVSKFQNLIELSHYGLASDTTFSLVECDQGLVILNVGSVFIACIQVSPTGSLEMKCLLPLPHSDGLSTNSSTVNDKVFHIVNGILSIFDPNVKMIFMHSIQTGICVCQIDLNSLPLEWTFLDWKLSFDHSAIVLLDNKFNVTKINLCDSSDVNDRVKWIQSEEKDKASKHELYKQRLCHFGDSSWRKEAVKHHVTASHKIKDSRKFIGFNASKPRKNSVKKDKQIVETPLTQSIELKEIKDKGWTVAAMETSSSVVTVVISIRKGNTVDEKAVCFVNFSNDTFHLQRLPKMSCFALSNHPSCLHIVWTESFLMYISPDSSLHKDDLISWMMAYSGPGAADALCQANQWTRTSIPMSALESSLKQRQLETLSFFYKSKKGLFSTWKHTQQPTMLRKEIQEMESTLHLVSDTVSVGMADPQARIFARRLLSLTIDFLYSLLEDAKECLEAGTCVQESGLLEPVRLEIQDSCGVLLRHISFLRKHMHLLENRSSQSKPAIFPDVVDVQQESDSGSDATLVQYVKDNKLSKLQALMQKNDGNVKTYQQIIAQLIEIIKGYLKEKDISSCQHVLNNLGCKVVDTLWILNQFYADRDLQEFVTGQLTSAASLTLQQRKVVEFMHQLYTAYPNRSFNNALKMRNDNNSCPWTKRDDRLKNIIPANNAFLSSQCGELSENQHTETDCKSELYSSVLLAWLNEWPEDVRKSVLIDAEFLTTEDEMSILKLDAQAVWRFLASHNMLETLQKVVTKSAADASFQWPSDPVADVQHGWSHLQKEILSLLLRLKKLNLSSCKSHEVDMQLLLHMVGGPLQQPHPLAYAGSSYLGQFHDLFINYCIRCGLQLPLWMYCRIHGIDVQKIRSDEEPSWFRPFQMFYSIPLYPKDNACVLLASHMAASELWSSSSSVMNVETILSKGHIMAAVATLSYMKQEDVMLNPETIEKYLQQFPKLKSVLLSESPNSATKPKITVYQLLMGSVPFNVRRLFGWHSANSFAGEDSPRVMPHFSEATTMGVQPSQQKLAFTYYLKQGRPMYAFLSFLVDELEKKEESISEKRIQQACGASLWVAIQNFNEPRITSGCVVFVEMLGRDSGLVRSMVHAGRTLLLHKKKYVNKEDKSMKEKIDAFIHEIIQNLQACVQSRRRFGPKLIASLQSVIVEEMRDENMNSASFEASQKWTLVNLLCQLLNVPLTINYLQACAEADNWLMFIWFAHLHQYPTSQLQGLLHAFRSIHFRDHLHYILNNAESKLFSSSSRSSSVASTPSVGASNEKKSAYQRSALYSKIGVNKDPASLSSDEEEKASDSPPVMSSFSSRLRHSEFHESEMPESIAPDDVFRMLFHSQAMSCQWRCLLAAAVSLRNPLFAELAACCGCPAIPSVCGWLLASLSSSVKQDFLDQHGQMVSKWTVEKLELLIEKVMDSRQEDSLATAFFMMQPKSPLMPFFFFINECMERGHHAASKTYIDQFKDAMATFENQSGPENQDSNLNGELPIIGDRAWIEKVVYQVLLHVLEHMTCIYKAHRFLELLDKHNMSLVFRFDVLSFSLLHQVVKILHDNEITGINLVSLLTSNTNSHPFEAECDKAVNFLIENGKFSEAMELAKVTGIRKEKVILGQLREEKLQLTNCGVWTAKYVRAQFWEKSCKMMAATCCSVTACEQFFQAELKGTEIEYEKALLCQHWFSLLENANTPDIVDKKENIFRDMWRHRIDAQMSLEEEEPLDHIFDNVKVVGRQKYLKSDLVLAEIDPPDVSDVQEDLSPQELEVLDSLMGSYLDQGQVNACARVAAVFGHYSEDLAIIETCIAMACGKNTIDNIEPAMRRLVAKLSPKRKLSSFSKSRSMSICSTESMESNISTDTMVPSKFQETVIVMEKLCEHCKNGIQVCRRIITCFKIAEILEMPYQEIVQAQEFDTLHRLLRATHVEKFDLAKEFLSTSGLLDEEVTKFLAGLILETLKAIVSRHTDSETGYDKSLTSVKPLLKSSDGMEVFAQFIKLSDNISLLGDQILQAVASLPSDDTSEMANGSKMSPTLLTIQTEMIILAHECYTSASNMEGISHVLRAARVCSNSLAQAGEFSLMIRLLTGVGRYSEMLFIFHALQQHHQFELLLRKGMDREDKLKVAILEFLKRFQPEDNEAYTMVALKFSMYRDIAGLLENCGQRAVRNLNARTLENNKETQESIKKCLQYFQEAAESFVKDMSVRKAQRCIKMARLLSLQQQLLSNGICVLNLSREDVISFVSNHTRFIESMVVSDAYEQKVNWRDAIFNNVLVGGDIRYLQEMKLHVHITPTLVEDVLHKYKNCHLKPSGNVSGIKKLLSHCKDAQLQYRLASELGLTDIVTGMLKGDTGNYLQDVTLV